MDSNHIVCYTGGTCGDLVVALIDSLDVEFQASKINHNQERSRLKKPHLFESVEEKDQYLVDVMRKYNSIPSHDLDYHMEQNHNIVSVVVSNFSVAVWAAHRFQQYHRPHVWKEMSERCGAHTVEDYAQIMLYYSDKVSRYTTNLIRLEDIVNGHAIDAVENYTKRSVDDAGKQIYKQWLILNERM